MKIKKRLLQVIGIALMFVSALAFVDTKFKKKQKIIKVKTRNLIFLSFYFFYRQRSL